VNKSGERCSWAMGLRADAFPQAQAWRMQLHRPSSARTAGLKSICWEKATRVGSVPTLGKACFMAMTRGFSAKALPDLPDANRH